MPGRRSQWHLCDVDQFLHFACRYKGLSNRQLSVSPGPPLVALVQLL